MTQQKILVEPCASCKKPTSNLFRHGKKYFCSKCFDKIQMPNTFIFYEHNQKLKGGIKT